MDTLQICNAISKQSGQKCKNFAVKNKLVCHIHGGKSTGAKTIEGMNQQKRASWKHGLRSKAIMNEKKRLRDMLRGYKQLLTDF